MIGRMLVTMVLAIAIPAFAQKSATWDEVAVPYDDVEWNELSGATQKDKRPLTIEQIDQLESRRKTERKTIWGLMTSHFHARNVSCIKAFAHVRYCRCLGEKLPAILSFEAYVKIITATKDELHYSAKTAEENKLIDYTTKVREQCVTSALDRQ